MLAHNVAVDTALNRVESRKKRVRNERGVSAVKYAYLSRAVHLELVGSYDNVETCGGEGKLALQIVLGLDNPKMEELSLYNKIVVIIELCLNLINFLTGETGNNTVNKRCIRPI